MNYWLTTQWPPREDESDAFQADVWVPDGREAAGEAMKEGDLILIYQSRSGPTEIRRYPDGTEKYVRCIQGEEGIVAIARVMDRFSEIEGSNPTTYKGKNPIWWRWKAPVDFISRSGHVPRVEVSRVLGYNLTYGFRGFGDYHSGLKRITREQYLSLVDLFRISRPIKLPPSSVTDHVRRRREGGGQESEDHRQLKEFIASDPEIALGESGLQHLGTEYLFPTGDQADVVLGDHAGRIVGVEIEVSVSDGQFEGILQAIKYRYMLEPIVNRYPGDSRAILVAYSMSKEMKAICNKYSVECFIVSKKEVEDWVSKRIPVIGIPDISS